MWCKSLGKERELSLIANQSDILKIKEELRKALKLGIQMAKENNALGSTAFGIEIQRLLKRLRLAYLDSKKKPIKASK